MWGLNTHRCGGLAASLGQPTIPSNTSLLSYVVYATTEQGDEKGKGQLIALKGHFMSFAYNLLRHPTVTEYLKLKQTFHSSHGITCSTIDASLPRARPHSSPRVTTALPSFTTMRFACFSSLRCANGFPWARLSGTVINGMLLQNRMGSFLNLWLWRGGSLGKKERKEKKTTTQF